MSSPSLEPIRLPNFKTFSKETLAENKLKKLPHMIAWLFITNSVPDLHYFDADPDPSKNCHADQIRYLMFWIPTGKKMRIQADPDPKH